MSQSQSTRAYSTKKTSVIHPFQPEAEIVAVHHHEKRTWRTMMRPMKRKKKCIPVTESSSTLPHRMTTTMRASIEGQSTDAENLTNGSGLRAIAPWTITSKISLLLVAGHLELTQKNAATLKVLRKHTFNGTDESIPRDHVLDTSVTPMHHTPANTVRPRMLAVPATLFGPRSLSQKGAA